MHKQVKDVLKEIETVQAEVDGYEIRANEATAEAEKLEATNHDDLISDPKKAEQITVKVMSAHRMQSAFESKIEECRDKVQELRRKALEVEADQLDKDADRVRKQLDQHNKKTAELLKALEDHQHVAYVKPIHHTKHDVLNHGPQTYTVPRDEVLRDEVGALELKAAMNRYYLHTGELTPDGFKFRKVMEEFPQYAGRQDLLAGASLPTEAATDLLKAVRNDEDLSSVPA